MQLGVTVMRRGLNLKLLAERFGDEVVQRGIEETADFAFDQMYITRLGAQDSLP